MVLDTELKLTDDCIIRLSEIKTYIDESLTELSFVSARLIEKDILQDILLDIYQILDRDIP